MTMTVPVLDIIRQRFINFIIRCVNGPSSLVAYMVQNSLLNLQMQSVITRNLFLCSEYLRCDVNSLLNSRLSTTSTQQFFILNCSVSDICAATAAAELVLARDGLFCVDGFNASEINSMLSLSLCN